MGDYEPDNSAQEGVSPDILPRMLQYMPLHLRCTADGSVETNNKDIPPTRPILHISALLLPYSHLPRLGFRIRRWFHTDPPHNARFYFWALLAALACRSHSILLPCRPITGPRQYTAARPTKRPIQPWRRLWQGRAGVWLLLGCGH